MSTLQVATASFRSAKMFTWGLIGNLKLRHWCVWLFVSVCGLAVNRRDWLQHLFVVLPAGGGAEKRMAGATEQQRAISGDKRKRPEFAAEAGKNHRCAALTGAISWRCDDCGWAGVKGSRGGSGGGARGRSQSE